MDIPSSSNVTGRRKRVAAADEMADDSFEGATPMRKVRGNKKIAERDVASNDLMRTVTNAADEIINKKGGTRLCFDYKSPLEMYSIERMIEAKASIQEMAIVLDSAQYLFGCRVDRLLADVRHVDAALSGGDLSRSHGGDDDVNLPIENRKAKKKMAVADGISGVSDVLDRIGEEEVLNEIIDPDTGRVKDPPVEDVEDETGDEVADFKDVDMFMEKGDVEDLINDLVINRAANFRSLLSADHSAFVSTDETAHDIKDSNIDFLRTNPTFQKATKGALDNKTNSFHSLNYYGIHTTNGRALVLHPRIKEEKKPGNFFPGDVSESLANNTRILLHNALERKPETLDNYLMLEVRDRPVIGKYKEVKKDAPKKILPLAEAANENDLINQAFSDTVQPNLNATVSGLSDHSMLPGNGGLPLNANQTIERASPNLDQTVSVQRSRANEEYVPPSLDKLNLEVSLIGKLPHDPMDMDKLTRIFDDKLETSHSSDAIDSKVWKNGMRAEEWGEDDDTAMKGETRHAIQAGIEGWIKATDSWTNYDVVKMIVNREARMQLDDSGIDEQESHRNLVPEIGKNFFLVRSDEFMNLYKKDTWEKPLIGDETDVMKMWPAEEEDANDAPLEEIQNRLREQHEQPEVVNNNMEEDDYQGGGNFDMEYDNNLAADIDFDDIEPVAARMNDGNDILFDDRLAEGEEQAHNVALNIPTIATGEAEIPELTCHRNLNEKIEPTAEQREEIRNAGKFETAHWHGNKHPDEGKQAALTAQRKRREKKAKTRKVTAEDFIQYFREVPEDEVEKEISSAKMKTDDKATYLNEEQLYLPTLGVESKPHIAFEMGILSNSGLFYKKSYGKIRLERVKQQKHESEIIVDEMKSNRDSDCLAWLATFSGFRCMENPVPVASSTGEHEQSYDYNQAEDLDFDFAAHSQPQVTNMRADLQKRFNYVSDDAYNVHRQTHREDTFDEFDDSYDRQTIQAKNLDAAKHKKCIAEILKSEHLSMPSIQFALEQLTINTTRADNTTVRGGPSTSYQDATTVSPQRSFEADKTLTSVFEYNAPTNTQHNVTAIMKALTETPDYQEEEPVVELTESQNPAASEYSTANTKNRNVKIQGCHTLLSLALSMPSKMGENVRPSSIVAFLLHIANENGLNIVQDRSKRTWMSDFMVLNDERMPTGVKIGNLEAQNEFWKRTQDPDAIEEGDTAANTTNNILGNIPRLTIGAQGRKRGAAQMAPTAALGAIDEVDEMAE